MEELKGTWNVELDGEDLWGTLRLISESTGRRFNVRQEFKSRMSNDHKNVQHDSLSVTLLLIHKKNL